MNLNQVTIPSTNLNRSVNFYKKLGMHLIVDALPRYVRFECPEGDSTFSIHLVSSTSKNNGVFIYFEVDNLDEKAAQLIEKGITFITTPKNQSWLWKEASLKDPDGNHIIIYNAGKNRKDPPWKITT